MDKKLLVRLEICYVIVMFFPEEYLKKIKEKMLLGLNFENLKIKN